MLNVSATTCTCRGYDPADPCGHGDVADGCPAHDPTIALCGSCEEFMPADGFVECESCGDEVCLCCAESGEQERETGWSADLCPSCADPDPRPTLRSRHTSLVGAADDSWRATDAGVAIVANAEDDA